MAKIAYLILAHADPEHFRRLCGVLNYEADIYAHIDSRADLDDFRLQLLPDCVQFVGDRVPVSWAGISMIDALLKLIRMALSTSVSYSHLVLMTGADYPIKSPKYIVQKLCSSPDQEYLKYMDMRENPEYYLTHVTRRWFKEPLFRSKFLPFSLLDKVLRRLGNYLRIPNIWNDELVPYYGHTWCALTLDCCRQILHFVDANPWFYAMNSHTFAPDEHFFHTIIGNSEFAANTYGVQPYEARGLWRVSTTHLIEATTRRWWDIKDWDRIRRSDHLFLRKVRTGTSTSLLDRIDNELLR